MSSSSSGRPPVIGIAGPPGSGKSTLARALVARFGGVVVSMDEHQRMTALPPAEVEAWLAAGADPDVLPMPGLAERLSRVRDEMPVGGVIAFETHFGRRHRSTGALIDRLVWLDTPLDIALARNLARFVDEARSSPAAALAGELAWMATYLGHYLGPVGRLVRWQSAVVRPDADLHATDPAGEYDTVFRLVYQLCLSCPDGVFLPPE